MGYCGKIHDVSYVPLSSELRQDVPYLDYKLSDSTNVNFSEFSS